MVLLGARVVIWAISQWRRLMNGCVLLWIVPLLLVLVVVQPSTLPARRIARQGENWRDVADMLAAGMRDSDALYLSTAPAVLLLAHHGWQPAGHPHGQAEGRW